MTTQAVPAPVPAQRSTSAATPRTSPGARYLGMWRRVPRELGYLAPAFLLAIAISQVLLWGLSLAAGLLFVLIGILLIPLTLLAARYAGTFETLRLRASAMPRLEEPHWRPPFAGKTFLRSMVDAAANPHHWLAYIHSALIAPVVATITFVAWTLYLSATLILVTTPIWLLLRPFSGGSAVYFDGFERGATPVDGWSVGDVFAYGLWDHRGPVVTAWLIVASVVLGLALMALYPFVSRGLLWAHWGPARLLLTRFPSERMVDEVAALSESRHAAVVAEDQALRRLERDIHDGPQQRLLRLQLDLASAERRLEDPKAAAELIASARLLARDTLDELRALTRGFAPPILQDRGLAAALESLGGRSAVPVETSIDLPGTIPGEIERGAYFIAAELVSNAVKHARARRIGLVADIRERVDADGVRSRELCVLVEDDGLGGAKAIPGHGLSGLSERLLGLRGALRIDSPENGPTTIRATIPLPADAAATPLGG